MKPGSKKGWKTTSNHVDSESLRLSLKYLAETEEWIHSIAKFTVYPVMLDTGNSVYLLLFSSRDFRQDTGNLAIDCICSSISAKYFKNPHD